MQPLLNLLAIIIAFATGVTVALLLDKVLFPKRTFHVEFWPELTSPHSITWCIRAVSYTNACHILHRKFPNVRISKVKEAR